MSITVSGQPALPEQEQIKLIQQQIKDHPILLYMKGTPEQPLCGFSHQAVLMLQQCGVSSFKSFDVLATADKLALRKLLPKISNWPTFPQLYLEGKLIGGVDIMTTLYANGELQKQLSNYIVDSQ